MGLEADLTELGVEPGPALLERLEGYLEVLHSWNRRFNLVSRQSEHEALPRHVLDSLSIVPHVLGSRLLDVGTGAGLPGLIVAMARPGLHCTLLDTSLKKTRFCRQVATELGLANVEVHRGRVEDFQPSVPYTTVVARAFRSAAELVALARPLCGTPARVISMKGAEVETELDGLGAFRENASVVTVSVPGLDAERSLLLVDLGYAGAGSSG